MFSFFKRGRSKDDEKKDKTKEKSSFSPFSKRHDSKKDSGGPSAERAPVVVSSLTSGPPDSLCDVRRCETDEKVQGQDVIAESNVEPSFEYPTIPTPPNDCRTLADSPVSEFERASSLSSDRGDSDTGFKTAPNTPVLSKHLALGEEVLIDAPTLEPPRDVETPSRDEETVEEDRLATLSAPSEAVVKVREEESECAGAGAMGEATPHLPGELYDIAEEGSSEDEDEDAEGEEDEEAEGEEEDEDEDSGNHTQPTIEDEYPDDFAEKNLVNEDGRLGLESNRLLSQIDELQRDIMVKTASMDRLQAELSAAYTESDLVRKKLRKVEEDLNIFKQKNSELTEELDKRSGAAISSFGEAKADEDFDWNRLLLLEGQMKELTGRVKELEEELAAVRSEKEQLEREARTLEAEREEEHRIVQKALDESLAEKKMIQLRYEKDFEKLRTVNTDREQQLLDDFEWKLREVEQACKRRLEDKERTTAQRIKVAEEKMRAVEQELAQVERLKQFEIEAAQLRGLNLEQQRALRVAERTREQLQVSEKVLTEELKKLKGQLDKERAALTTMQAIHNREIDEMERKMRFRLEQQKTELNSQWEEKLRKETLRLKIELDQINRDEKRLTLESARLEKEEELRKAKEKWDQRFENMVKEVDILKQKLADKEADCKENVESIRTKADRDIFELRRKLDRIDLSYQEKIEKLQNDHDSEKARLAEEAESKLQASELHWQHQLGSTRTTLELVKEQARRDASELALAHRQQLEEQWDQLTQERDEALAALEEQHRAEVDDLTAQLSALTKSHAQELQGQTEKISKEIRSDEETSSQSFNCEVVNSTTEDDRLKEQTENKLRLVEEAHRLEAEKWRASADQLEATIAHLTKQLEESRDSKILEDLRKSLGEKELQVAQLSKEKHLYQLELMNRNTGNGEPVAARQRRKGGRGKGNRHK